MNQLNLLILDWSSTSNFQELIGRKVKTSTVSTTTTVNPETGEIIVSGVSMNLHTKGRQLRKFKVSLFKCEDDWFLAQIFINCEFRYHDEGFWFKIDQVDGVINFLQKLFTICPSYDYTRIENILDEIIAKNSSENNNGYLPYLFNHEQIEQMWIPVALDVVPQPGLS